MAVIIGLLMIAGQIFGTVRVFGGAKNSPLWLDIVTGVLMILFFIGAFGLATQ